MDGRRWDFFVSYASADVRWARWIAWQLEAAGFSVLIQDWDFVPGTNWIDRMHEAIQASARTIAVLSPDYLESDYAAAEWQAAWAADPDGEARRLLTVRVVECERPGLLAGVTGIDVFGMDDEEAAARLARLVASLSEGRAKPAERPAFPGGTRLPPESSPSGLPQIFDVPARNPNFTGRRESLARLQNGLAQRSVITVYSMRGMAGIGKTQLAIEYAHAHATEYEIVFWVNSEQPERLQDQFAMLATKLRLELPVATPREDLVAAVHDTLRRRSGFLLIFDNAERLADLKPYLPVGVVPAATAAHVVITTRWSGFAALGPVLEVDVLDRDESVALLRRRSPELAADVADAMAEWLGDLPLALEQASAYLEQTGLPADEYLRLLRTRSADLHRRGRVGDRHDTIATMWDLTLERLTAENPAAVQLLGICAHLAPEPIPMDLLTEHTNLLPQPLAAAAADEVIFNDTVGALVHLSLARRTSAGLVMHRLVQAVVRDRQGAVQPLEVAVSLLRAHLPEAIVGEPLSWPAWQELLAHVLAVTSQDVPEESADAATRLLSRAATYMLLVRARPSDSLPLFERALAIDEQRGGPDQAAVADDLNNFAMALQDVGDPASARPLLERALAIDETLYGPDHPNVAMDLNNLALVVQDLGEPQVARVLVERALAIDRRFFEAENPALAVDLNNLAMILQDLGQVEAAIPLLAEALEIQRSARGDDHTHVAVVLNNLATAFLRTESPETAKPMLEQAVAVFESRFGERHGDYAICLGNLGLALRDLGDPEGAERLLARAIAIHGSTHGERHPESAVWLNSLAVVAMDREDFGRARELLERALALDERAKGPRHPSLITTLQNLGEVFVAQRDDSAARAALKRAARIAAAAYGSAHRETRGIRIRLAELGVSRARTD